MSTSHRPPQTSLLPATETSVRHHLRALGYGDVPEDVVNDFVKELNQLDMEKTEPKPRAHAAYSTSSASTALAGKHLVQSSGDSFHSSSLPERYSYKSFQPPSKPTTFSSSLHPSSSMTRSSPRKPQHADVDTARYGQTEAEGHSKEEAISGFVELETVDADTVRKQLRELGYTDSAIPESVIHEFTRELQDMYEEERSKRIREPSLSPQPLFASVEQRQREHEQRLDASLAAHRSQTIREEPFYEAARPTTKSTAQQRPSTSGARFASPARSQPLSTYPTGTSTLHRRVPQTAIARYAVPPEPSRLRHDPVARYHALQQEWNKDNFLRRLGGKPAVRTSRPTSAPGTRAQRNNLSAVEQMIQEAQVSFSPIMSHKRLKLMASFCRIVCPRDPNGKISSNIHTSLLDVLGCVLAWFWKRRILWNRRVLYGADLVVPQMISVKFHPAGQRLDLRHMNRLKTPLPEKQTSNGRTCSCFSFNPRRSWVR